MLLLLSVLAEAAVVQSEQPVLFFRTGLHRLVWYLCRLTRLQSHAVVVSQSWTNAQ